jgi:NDP-sugar pyrophosphorylase family protein
MKIIVPMAGRGSRFQVVSDQNSEYKKPKPLINVKGEPMVSWAIKSLPFVNLPGRTATTDFVVETKDLTFIALQEHETNHQVTEVLKKTFSPDINVVLIPEVTRGAAETVLAAEKYITPDEDLIITDSDHFFDGSNLYTMIRDKEADVAGIIPVFQPPDAEPKWSFTLFDKDQTVLAVGEKDAELAAKGASANIGAYYFTKGKVFVDEAKAMVSANDMYGPAEKAEFYIAPMYQRLINKGMKVKAAIIPEVWGLGTPKDLEYFLANYKG